MTRASRTYGDRSEARVFAGVPAWPPIAGFYRFRLRSGAVKGVAKVWYGAPLDPVTGEELDRGWRWQALLNGEPVDLDRVWPVGAGDPVTEADYRYACSRQDWARQNAPESAFAEPDRRYDPLSAPMPF